MKNRMIILSHTDFFGFMRIRSNRTSRSFLFSFHDGSIKLIFFRTTKVQIKPIKKPSTRHGVEFPSHNGSDQTDEYPALMNPKDLGFHPTMVRIKRVLLVSGKHLIFRFPSHNGSDQTGLLTLSRAKFLCCFHPTMVRIKLSRRRG